MKPQTTVRDEEGPYNLDGLWKSELTVSHFVSPVQSSTVCKEGFRPFRTVITASQSDYASVLLAYALVVWCARASGLWLRMR